MRFVINRHARVVFLAVLCLANGYLALPDETEVICDGCEASAGAIVNTPTMPPRAFPPSVELDGECNCLVDEQTGNVIKPCRDILWCKAEQHWTEPIGAGNEICWTTVPGPPGPGNPPALCCGNGVACFGQAMNASCSGNTNTLQFWAHPVPDPGWAGPWFLQVTLFAICAKCNIESCQ